jgi:WD40 repeat protein
VTPFFTAGGTLSRAALSYIPREADEKLYRALSSGLYAYLLNSRQMGKSSLAVRTLDRLRGQGVTCAMVDLTRLGGQNLTATQWYAALTREAMFGAGAQIDLAGWMRESQQIAPARAFFDFLEGPLLDAVSGNLVLLLDEIDVTQNLNFDTDGFYAGIRDLYNRRSIDSRLNRLTFCLVGVALPSDLISDPRVTPFNIGERIVLRDFTAEELAAYGTQLGPHGEAIIARLHHWTGGHPYLTQSLCSILSERPELTRASQVDAFIREIVIQPAARETNTNLVDVAKRVLYSGTKHGESPSRADTLTLYERVWRGRNVHDDESNLPCAGLKLSGIVKSVGGTLRVRNRIYSRVFDGAWIQANMPEQEARRQRRAYRRGVLVACAIGLPVVSVITGLAAVAIGQARRADRFAALASEKALSEHRARTEQERSTFKAYAMALNETARTFEAGQYGEAMRNLVDLQQQPGRGWELSYLANRIGRYGHVNSTGKSRVGGVGYESDGSLVTLSDDRRIRIWSKDGLTLLRTILIPIPGLFLDLRVDTVADAAFVYTGRGHLAKISLASGRVDWETTTDIGHFYSCDVQSGQGHFFQFNSVGSGLILGIDEATGKETWRHQVAHLAFESGAVSADGTRIIYGGHAAQPTGKPPNYFLGCIEVASGRNLWMREVGKAARVTFVASANDGRSFWVGRRSGDLARIDGSTGQPLSHVQIRDGHVNAVSRLPRSGRWMVCLNRGIRILDPGATRVVDQFESGRQAIFQAVSSDGGKVAIAGLDGETTVWNLTRYDQGPGASERRWFDSSAFLDPRLKPRETYIDWNLSRDGRTLVAEHGTQATWSVYRFSDGERLWSFEEPLTDGPVFSEDGKVLAAGLTRSCRIGLFDSQTGKALLTTPGAYPLSFSPDGTQILTGGGPAEEDRKLVRAFDVRTGRLTLEVRVNEDLATAGAWSADGKRLLLGGEDHIIRYFDIPTHQLLVNMPGHDSQVSQLEFCEDGKSALSTGDDGTTRIWKLGSPDAEHTLALPADRGPCRACELPGGRVLASWPNKAGIFDIDTGQTMMLFPTGEKEMRFFVNQDGRAFGLSRKGELLELTQSFSKGRARS